MAQTTQTRKIQIVFDAKGTQEVKKIADQLGGLNRNTKSLADSMSFLKGATASWLGGLSIQTLASFSDSIENLNNKLLAMTGSQQQATDTMHALLKISRDTNQALEGTSQSYFRMSQALRDAGISQASLLAMTKTISNTFRLSGASTEEATNATIQLGQAFSLGVLRGQDLRSVMSQNVVLTRLLRQEFGTELLKSAEKGLITVPRLMRILQKSSQDVNDQAKLMNATFEQSSTKVLDAFKVKINEVATSMGASSLFAQGANLAIDNMGKLTTVMAVLAAVTLPNLIKQLGTLAASFGLLNVGALSVTAFVASLVAANPATTNLLSPLEQLDRALVNFNARMAGTILFMTQWLEYIPGAVGGMFKAFNALLDSTYQSSKKKVDEYDALANQMKAIAEKGASPTWGVGQKFSPQFGVKEPTISDSDIEKAEKFFKRTLTAKEQLQRLNAEFSSGRISVSEYNEQILTTAANMSKWKFSEGEEDLGKLNDQLRKLETFNINRQFKEGALTADEFTAAINRVKQANLKEDLDAGRISLEDYNKALAGVASKFSAGGAFTTGLQDYISSVGSSTQQVADLIKDTFKNLEDAMVQFVKKGKFDFNDFTQAVLDDLLKIIIRMSIIQPIAKGLLGAFTAPAKTYDGYGSAGGSGADYSTTAATGKAFGGGNVIPFAKGGVVGGATTFGYGNGKTGLMGEAGPEAILPLKRGTGGDLGVKASVTPVTINIINQSGNEVKQSESTGPNGEKQIEILITSKVREGLATGKYDKIFKSAYGLNRRGS